MPTKRLTMRRIHRLMTLHFGAGAGTRVIARELGISHSTVREYLARITAAGITWPLPVAVTDETLERQLFANGGVRAGARHYAAPDWAVVARELKRPGVNLMILWEEYRAAHADGYAYSRYCQLFREFERRLSPSMRQTHVAGDKAFVDFSGKRMPIIDPKSCIFTPSCVTTCCRPGRSHARLRPEGLASKSPAKAFRYIYQDADNRVWTRIAGVVIAASRRLIRPATLPAPSVGRLTSPDEHAEQLHPSGSPPMALCEVAVPLPACGMAGAVRTAGDPVAARDDRWPLRGLVDWRRQLFHVRYRTHRRLRRPGAEASGLAGICGADWLHRRHGHGTVRRSGRARPAGSSRRRSETLVSGAKLIRANLSNANLMDADLTGARNLTQHQLDKTGGKPRALPPGLTLDKPPL